MGEGKSGSEEGSVKMVNRPDQVDMVDIRSGSQVNHSIGVINSLMTNWPSMKLLCPLR